MTDNPYEPPAPDIEPVPDIPFPTSPGGIGRLTYWVGMWAMGGGMIAWFQLVPPAGHEWWPSMVFWIACGFLAHPRLKNIGMNPKLGIATIMPILNLFIIFRCLVFPQNYHLTRQLDRAAKNLIACIILLFGLMVFLAVEESWSG